MTQSFTDKVVIVTGAASGIGRGCLHRFASEGAITPIPVGRVGPTEEIAHVVCMIASPASGNMTGANILVDGTQVGSVN